VKHENKRPKTYGSGFRLYKRSPEELTCGFPNCTKLFANKYNVKRHIENVHLKLRRRRHLRPPPNISNITRKIMKNILADQPSGRTSAATSANTSMTESDSDDEDDDDDDDENTRATFRSKASNVRSGNLSKGHAPDANFTTGEASMAENFTTGEASAEPTESVDAPVVKAEPVLFSPPVKVVLQPTPLKLLNQQQQQLLLQQQQSQIQQQQLQQQQLQQQPIQLAVRICFV
jgi:hypothetical protein